MAATIIVTVATVLVLTTVVVPDAMTVLAHVKELCLVGGADVEGIAKTTVETMVVMVHAVVVVVEIVILHVVVALITVVVAVARVSEEDVPAVVLVPPSARKSYSGIASRVTIVYFIYTQYNPSSQSPPQSICE